MEDEEDHHWQYVKGRHRKTKGNVSLLPDIATARGARHEKHDNLTTYFFSDFPVSFGAKAMFNAFTYYGDIVEVVIPAKRDKGGRRFGFARFDRVRDVRQLEKELDTILIGRDKISVNLSRFHRTTTAWRPVPVTKEGEGYRRSRIRNGDVQRHRSLSRTDNQVNQQLKETKQSYALAVKQGKEVKKYNTPKHVMLYFEAAKEDMSRLKKAFIGEVIQPGMSYNIQNAFHRQAYFGVKVTPLGANLTLLEGQEEGEVQALRDDAKGWMEQWFKDIRPWSPKEIDTSRVAWLRVYGIPSHAWNDLFFTKLAKSWGEFLNSDESTTKRITMDVARLLIRTSCQQHVDEVVEVMVNGEIFRLRVLEDSNGPMRIILPQNNIDHDRNDGSEEEEDEEDDEEVEGLGRLMMEEVGDREFEGGHNNALNVEDIMSVARSNGLNEKEPNNLSMQSGGEGDLGGCVCKKDSRLMKGRVLLGQEEVDGGPQNTTSIQSAVKGGAGRRFTQSEVVGQVHHSESCFNSGGSTKQHGGVYSDGPRNVYLQLTKGPTLISPTSQRMN
jgi:hypothetical protein